MRSAWLGLVLAVACGGGGSDHAPAMPAEGGSSTGGTRTRPVTTAGTNANEAGAAGDSSAQGGAAAGEASAGDAGQGIVFQEGGAPPVEIPGVCAPTMKLGSAQTQDVGVADITLLAMTADERSVAFTTGSGVELTLRVADRDSNQAAFEEVPVALPDGFDVESGVSLSSDGRKLILVMSDHSGFGELSRAARGDAFAGDADVTAYARINGLKPMSGHSVGWPVLSHDGKDLYFVSYFGSALVNQSKRDSGGVFDIGTEIDEFTLGGPEGEYKLLSGLSSDQRAIFFFDQKSQHAMALFRSRDGAPFYDPLDLGARRGATPNQDCSRVYSSTPSGLVAQPSR
ncbi:MAG: hypothetical protein ABUL60_18700 [Myxococcales bacterium]